MLESALLKTKDLVTEFQELKDILYIKAGSNTIDPRTDEEYIKFNSILKTFLILSKYVPTHSIFFNKLYQQGLDCTSYFVNQTLANMREKIGIDSNYQLKK